MCLPLLAYVGPETTVPLLSFLASLGGFLLMFGKTTIRFAVRKVRGLLGLRDVSETVSGNETP